MKRKLLSLWAIIAVLLAIPVSIANAQLATTTAALSGTVSDPGGALVPQARLTLTSPETGTSRESTTNADGRFLLQPVTTRHLLSGGQDGRLSPL